MDPNLFHVDWERLFEVLVAVVIMAFLLERALALLFETRFFIELKKGKKEGKERSLKEPIAFLAGVLVCVYWDFDAVSMIFLKGSTTILGEVITGAIVAGGSKAAVKLLRDTMKFMSSAERERQDLKEIERKKRLGEGS